MLALAGCQSVNGLDLNQAWIKSATATSLEASGSWTIDMDIDEDADVTPETRKELEGLKRLLPITLELTHVKQQDERHLSAEGAFALAKGKIPFRLAVTPEAVSLSAEGVAKPLLLELDETAGFGTAASLLDGGIGPLGGGKDARELLQNKELQQALTGYLVRNLPNPGKLTAEPVNGTVHGENLPLYKVQAEIGQEEFQKLLRTFLLRLAQDDQGMKEVIALYYDALKPVFDAAAADEDAEDEELGLDVFGGGMNALLNDKEVAVEFLHGTIKAGLALVLSELGASENNPSLPFGKGTELKAELYVDRNLHIRKTNYDLTLKAPDGAGSDGVSAIRVTGSMETWNVGGAVKAGEPETEGAVSVADLDDASGLLDENSLLYDVLKNDLYAFKQEASFYFFLPDKSYNPDFTVPYIEDGTTMVPVTGFADRLGMSVAWNPDKRTVTVTDPRTESVLELYAGSGEALLNGKPYRLALPAVIRDGTTYAPLKSLADAFGFETIWDEETETITIIRY